MLYDLIRKSFLLLLFIWIVCTANFFISRSVPGSPFLSGGDSSIGFANCAIDVHSEHGFDDPLLAQYLRYCKQCFRDKGFGSSFLNKNRTLKTLLLQGNAWWKSCELALLSMMFGVFISVLLGLFLAYCPDSFWAKSLHIYVGIARSVPIYLLYPFLIELFAVRFKLFSISGWGDYWFGSVSSLTLPVLVLTIGHSAAFIPYFEASFSEVLRSHYFRTALSKGLCFDRLFFSHLLIPGLVPLIHQIILRLRFCIMQGAYLEILSGISGIGRAVKCATDLHEYNLIMGFCALVLLLSQVLFFFADCLVKFLDPRRRKL